MSVIVVDDVERLLEFVRIGPRFSNAVLQTLMVLYKKAPEKGRKLLILSTTSNKQVLDDMGMLDSFHAVLKVPCIEPGQEVKEVLTDLNIFQPREMKQVVDSIVTPVAVKKLLMITEMAQQGEHGSLPERFIQCLADYTDF
jgi:vesicle-fusing ATPase